MKKLLKLHISHVYYSAIIIKNWVILSEDLYTDERIGNIHFKMVELLHKHFVPKAEEFCKQSKKPKWFYGSHKEFDDNMIVMKLKLKEIVERRKKIINRYTEIDDKCRSESEDDDDQN